MTVGVIAAVFVGTAVCFLAVVATCAAGEPDTGFDWRTDNAAVLGFAPDPRPRRTRDPETLADVIDLLQWELEFVPA